MKYVVIYHSEITDWEYFDDLKEAAKFAARKEGVLLKVVEYKVEETESEDE